MRILIPCLFLLVLISISCKSKLDDQLFIDKDFESIADYMEINKESYSKFYRILVNGELMDALSAYNPSGNGFTLFLPTDEAFEQFILQSDEYESFEELLLDTVFVRFLGRYHLLNISIQSNDFPFGALPDTTASGDQLTIGFSTNFEKTVYKVNNMAPIVTPNLEMVNGYIHIISEVLKPIDFSGYDWLKENEGYSILFNALELTGFKGRLGINNKYTILAEHDSIYKRYGINNIDDLIDIYATPGLPYNNSNNSLYQFAAYHVLRGSYFLADFEWGGKDYRSYASKSVEIDIGIEIRINPGVDTFSLVISEFGDTAAVTHIGLFFEDSNVLTKTGAVHFISELMYFYKPPLPDRIYRFYEEPVIDRIGDQSGSYYLYEDSQEELQFLSWTGPDSIRYYQSSGQPEIADTIDFLELDGNFNVNYNLSRVLPGKYSVNLSAHAWDTENGNATVIVYLDGKKLGESRNLNLGGNSAEDPFHTFKLGKIEFVKYEEHNISIESLVPGRFRWEFISLIPYNL